MPGRQMHALSLNDRAASCSQLDTDALSSIACPICQEEMLSLQQLNRHLDDAHVEVAQQVQEVGIRSWFGKQISRSSKLAPVAAIAKTLKFVEPFERNGAEEEHVGIESAQETDSIVSRAHWQKESKEDYCTLDNCRKRLGGRIRAVNCRHCGKLYCDQHTLCQMRLSRSAVYEPVRGHWCRVCISCYEGRDWYHDKEGCVHDRSAELFACRRGWVDRARLEANRLEKRLSKLLASLADLPKEDTQDKLFGLVLGKANPRRLIEQQAVPWEDDTTLTECRDCKLPYSYSNRKHHCRLCGQTTCGNAATRCSTEIAFDVAIPEKVQQARHAGSSSVTLRLCRNCEMQLSDISPMVEEETAGLPLWMTHYTTLRLFQTSIESLMPRFQALLSRLDDTSNFPTSEETKAAARVRKRLVDAMTQYDLLAKKIAVREDEKATISPAETKLRGNVVLQAGVFLQRNLVPLQHVPSLSQLRKRQADLASTPDDAASLMSGETMSSEESKHQQEQRQIVMVLKEQEFLLQEELDRLKRRRKFEEVKALSVALAELGEEITKQVAILGQDL
ncbi:hypothetical protein BCR37DRAFT_390524 [Protomyces lactucae-debilis]|uniref:FYVE-type domain-containing protein n=1 Tax=Protomyces lactucae-debilis TaxID=2754530 RepID=A0A1Y2FU09_PROLT|nr:uncharacterized protein BCR37DRAFT_390524 [Protomyces lactucae-debilis]ORY86784.1 hypothetical protein BCR37DRAFT_390524 [Protomyces lactucae-debilis]